ncbi:MAG: BlaI/MecI/CopY family transcriptional regulator [Limisphaerales bacterium]
MILKNHNLESSDMKKTGKKLPPLSEAQMEIMREVWKRDEVTVTDVWTSLQRQRGVARNTVHTLMERLTQKGWLKRRFEGQTHYYSAASSRIDTMRDVVNRLVDTAFEGSAEGLVLTLFDGRMLTAAEASRIRALIEHATEEGEQ